MTHEVNEVIQRNFVRAIKLRAEEFNYKENERIRIRLGVECALDSHIIRNFCICRGLPKIYK